MILFHLPVSRSILPAVLLLLLTGCGPALRVDPSEAIARAAGAGNLIEYRVSGERLDSEPADGLLRLHDALRRAVEHSPELQAALARVRAAQADAEQTHLLPNPILSVAVRLPGNGGGGPLIEAGLTADLIAVLQQPRRTRAADARLRAASADALAVALDRIAEVHTTYATVQALDAQRIVLNDRRALIARLLTLAKSRVEIGESPQLDVLTLDSERVSLEVEITERASELRQRRLELARMIGQPTGGADWPLPAFQPPEVVSVEEGMWIERALENQPGLQARRWQLEAAAAEASIAGSSVLDGGNIGLDAERDDRWTVGPAMSTPLPIFDWGQARRRKAMAQVVQSRHELSQARRLVVQEIRLALDSLTSAQAAIARVQDELIPIEQRRTRQAEAAYANDLADITAVIIAEQQSQAARQKLIELQQKANAAFYRLQRSAGGPGVMPPAPSVQSEVSTAPTTEATP